MDVMRVRVRVNKLVRLDVNSRRVGDTVVRLEGMSVKLGIIPIRVDVMWVRVDFMSVRVDAMSVRVDAI